MEKLKMGIRVFVLMLLMQVHVFATQVYEESENITDTESVVGQDLTEKNETNKTGQAAFNIHINVPDGFMDEIQLLLQFTTPSGLHSVLERPFSEANGRPFLVKRSPLIVC